MKPSPTIPGARGNASIASGGIIVTGLVPLHGVSIRDATEACLASPTYYEVKAGHHEDTKGTKTHEVF